MAKSSPKPPWVLTSDITRTSPGPNQRSPVSGACAGGNTRAGHATICGESGKNGKRDDDEEGVSGSCGGARRWGAGIFVHTGTAGASASSFREYWQTERDRASYHPRRPERESYRKSRLGTEDCERGCHSASLFRPNTANLGYRTRPAYTQGYGTERLGHIFEEETTCSNRANAPQVSGIGFSRKISGGGFKPSVEPRPQSAPSAAQLSAAASARAKVEAAVERDPTLDESTKGRLYASEFFCKNPCIAYLPWQGEKKKKKAKTVKAPKPKKCVCAAHVNTVPMTNAKFTETDFLTYDQCTWTDNQTFDKGEGTEVTTCDQFTNVTPRDIDGPPPIPMSVSRRSASAQVSLRSKSASSSYHTPRGSVQPPQPPEGGKMDNYSHTLVNHPSVGLNQPSTVSVPVSFAKMGLGGEEQQPLPVPWDGLISSGQGLICCPPCVGDPCSLSRFWRRTPKFSDVVRAPPLCDCCSTVFQRPRGV